MGLEVSLFIKATSFTFHNFTYWFTRIVLPYTVELPTLKTSTIFNYFYISATPHPFTFHPQANGRLNLQLYTKNFNVPISDPQNYWPFLSQMKVLIFGT